MSTSILSRAALLPDVEYGRAGTVSLRMDASIPEGPGPFPAVILVHGGGWVRGNRKTDVAPLFQPLSDAGFAWFSISYRLASDFTDAGGSDVMATISSLVLSGGAIEDVQQAISHVKTHAAEYRIDPDRIALIGESAGAQLASMAALKPGTAGPVKAVVAFYSPSDLVALVESSKQIPDSVRRSVKGTPWADLLVTGLRTMSPINLVHSGMPPFLLIHGTADAIVPYEQSEKMCLAIRQAGGACKLIAVRGGGHGMRWWEGERLTGYKPKLIQWLETELMPSPHVQLQSHLSATRS